jgi:cytochrome P450
MTTRRPTELDRQWEELMSLCREEAALKRDNPRPMLLKFLGNQIDRLAGELGFSDSQIRRREFRAEKDGEHIVRMIAE